MNEEYYYLKVGDIIEEDDEFNAHEKMFNDERIFVSVKDFQKDSNARIGTKLKANLVPFRRKIKISKPEDINLIDMVF